MAVKSTKCMMCNIVLLKGDKNVTFADTMQSRFKDFGGPRHKP